jgi:hypothetical protein
MARSSARRAQTEPVAALVAVFVVGLALATYAGAFETLDVRDDDRALADPTVERIERALTSGGVVQRADLSSARRRGPEGYRLNVTLRYGDSVERAGPTPPPSADRASRRVSVAVGPGAVVGRLEVSVWA